MCQRSKRSLKGCPGIKHCNCLELAYQLYHKGTKSWFNDKSKTAEKKYFERKKNSKLQLPVGR